MFFKIGVPKNLQLYLDGLQLYLKETLTQMVSCEILQIFKNTFFTERFLRWLLLEGVYEGTSLVKILEFKYICNESQMFQKDSH